MGREYKWTNKETQGRRKAQTYFEQRRKGRYASMIELHQTTAIVQLERKGEGEKDGRYEKGIVYEEKLGRRGLRKPHLNNFAHCLAQRGPHKR